MGWGGPFGARSRLSASSGDRLIRGVHAVTLFAFLTDSWARMRVTPFGIETFHDRSRGLTGVQQAFSDAHAGLRAAIEAVMIGSS